MSPKICLICTSSSLISSTLNNIFDTIYIVHTPLQIVMTLLSFASKYFGYDVIRIEIKTSTYHVIRTDFNIFNHMTTLYTLWNFNCQIRNPVLNYTVLCK